MDAGREAREKRTMTREQYADWMSAIWAEATRNVEVKLRDELHYTEKQMVQARMMLHVWQRKATRDMLASFDERSERALH